MEGSSVTGMVAATSGMGEFFFVKDETDDFVESVGGLRFFCLLVLLYRRRVADDG